MRLSVLSILILALLALGTVPAAAQPKHGDVVLTALFVQNNAFNQGLVLHFDPTQPGTQHILTTIAQNSVQNSFANWIRMAPNNSDMLTSWVVSTFAVSNLVYVDKTGWGNTLAKNLLGGAQGFELDGDNTWVVAADAANDSLYGVEATQGTVNTFFATPASGTFNGVTVVREGTLQYAIASFVSNTLPAGPKIYGADRNGITTTILTNQVGPLTRLSGIELEPKTGNLITCSFDLPNLARVTKTGKISTVALFSGANGSKINRDNTIYVIGYQGATNALLKYDLVANAMLTIYSFPGLASTSWSLSGLDVYGSRVLTCNGQGGPGATIAFNIKSHHPKAGGAAYQIALSTGRRPGVKLPNGESLYLNVTDPIFFITAQNLLPLAKNFAGVLNAFGSIPPGKPATLKLPPGFPANLGIPIFAACVIISGGIVEVSNTHWFEL